MRNFGTCLVPVLGAGLALAVLAAGQQSVMSNMAHMPGHMHMSSVRPVGPGDQARAQAIVEAARKAMEPYRDYKKALADGYVIFHENLPQPQYHFTNYANARIAQRGFDASRPTSLLYKKNAGGGYTLVGAMYTAPVNASEDELNRRIPLSIAHWHQHVNFCIGPAGTPPREYFGKQAKFGLMGSITTEDACRAAGGTFRPHVFGWMVHVYPYESDPAKIWSTGDDDHGHDNMDHMASPGKMGSDAMPGMTMN